MPDPGRADDPAEGVWANTVPGGIARDSGAAVVMVTLNPSCWATAVAFKTVIPTTFGTDCVALAAGGVPPTAWQGDSGVGASVGSMPGSIGASVPVDGAEAIASSTSAPGTASLPAGSDWALTVPDGTWADPGGTAV
jgi:hypothetical protein